jgi:hypothetical protein
VTGAPPPPRRWRTADELLAIGLAQSRVVMMNEAHSGLRRCVRTRRVGTALLPYAHDAGVRCFAMEALLPSFAAAANATREVPAAEAGYLAQPEMRELIATALGLGWRLAAYEADFSKKPSELEHLSLEETNWREEEQARNLCAVLQSVASSDRLLVWCGNHHLAKDTDGRWVSMGIRFARRSGLEPFAIDQIPSVNFGHGDPLASAWLDCYRDELEALGGAAGFLSEEAPPGWPSVEIADAFLLALENDLE